jgi:hypothetical protein
MPLLSLLSLNFLHLHYLYFLVTTVVCAAILWGTSTPGKSISFVDSLFFAVSAMTEAGLNTVNLSTLNTFQQCILFLLILIGSSIWVSAWIVWIRRRAFGGLYCGKPTFSRTSTIQSAPPTTIPNQQVRRRAREREEEPVGGVVGRNSNFHHLDSRERERLCRTEYKAVVFLSWTVPIYFVTWQILGCLSLGAYISANFSSVTRENGLDPW